MGLERLFSQSHRTKYVNRFCDDEKISSGHILGTCSERKLLGSYQSKELDREDILQYCSTMEFQHKNNCNIKTGHGNVNFSHIKLVIERTGRLICMFSHIIVFHGNWIEKDANSAFLVWFFM